MVIIATLPLKEQSMLKRIFLLVALVTVMAAVPAAALDFEQKQWYGQGIVALPMGNFGDFANLGIGAGIGVLVPHSPEFSFRGEVSYIYFTTEDFSFLGESADVSASQIPITALAQYNLADSEIYLLGGLGLVMAKLSIDYPTVSGIDLGGGVSDTQTEIGITLGAGTKLKPNLSLEGRLNMVGDGNSISANLGWFF